MASGMDFFGHQERARRATGRLVLLFALAVVAIAVCIHLAASLLVVVANEGSGGLWRGDVMLVTFLATTAVVLGGALFKTSQLAKGGTAVATLMGGRLVPVDPTDPKERMLRNLVEEMAIASGVPVPEIFVLDGEQGINAFAAGWTPADAAVAVTRGCLEQFDRDELQGVIAHEFSHVFHGDMRLNIRLMGVLFGIVCITTIGRIVVESVGRGARGSSGKGKGGVAGVVLFGIALVVIGWLGVLFARLIQAAVSRQREFLADASAVAYTRNPRGIGMALAKIGGIGSRLRSPHTEEASHLLFADGMRRFFGGAMASHPPIEERVERVLPGFRRQVQSAGSFVEAVNATPSPGLGAVSSLHVVGPRRVATDEILASIGEPQPEHVDAAREALNALPLELSSAVRDPRRAAALVHALLLDREPAVRQRQLQPLLTADPTAGHDALVLAGVIDSLPTNRRLPLFELAVPALRQLPSEARERLRRDARALAAADGRLQPFEFALLHTMERHVRLSNEPPPRPPGRPTALAQHGREVAIVVSTIAHLGAGDDDTAAATAFARARDALGVPQPLDLVPRQACGIEAMDSALTALHRVSPFGKRNLLAACAAAAAADGTVTVEEADVLRALAGLWDCPVPFVTGDTPAPAIA